MRVSALIPAAGRGRRMGEETPKAFLPLGGIPILARALRVFESCAEIQEIVVLVPRGGWLRRAKDLAERFGLKKISRIVAGGAERQDSVFRGLKALSPATDLVLIHDGARPFVTRDLIAQAIAETRLSRAAVTAVPVRDTIKEIGEDRRVLKTLDRSRLWEIQTPQGFHFPLIRAAYEKAFADGFYGTDDAALVERLGIAVKVVPGGRFNLKITTPEDLALGEALLKMGKKRAPASASPRNFRIP